MSPRKPQLPADKKKQRAIIWSSAIAGLLLVGGIASACDPSTSQPSQPVGNIATITNTTTATPTTESSIDTDTSTAVLVPATTIAAPPPVTQAPQQPVTYAAPPPADTESDCTGDYYLNSDGNCVHRPEAAGSAPTGATAQCKDGTYSFSQHRSGTCSGHHGVEQWLTG